MRRRLYKYHPVIGYLKMPNRRFRLHFSDGTFKYQTNSAGFRGNGEFQIEKRDGTQRALVFGDSFTEGGCVHDGDRYSDILQASTGVEMYNFGISGTGTDQQYLIYREIAAQYEHDLIVVGVWAENIRRNVSSSRVHGDQDGNHLLTPKPYFTLDDDDRLEIHNQPVPRPVSMDKVDASATEGIDPGTLSRTGLKGRAAEVITRLGPTPKRLAQRAVKWQPYPEYDDPAGTPWRITRRILEQWADEAQVPMLVVPIPVYQYVERTAPSDAMRARFAELDAPPALTVHDPLPDLWSYPKADRVDFRFPTDHHLTPSGHAALARSIEPNIRRLLDL